MSSISSAYIIQIPAQGYNDRNILQFHLNLHGNTRLIPPSHSFGSAQTYSLVNLYPTISDGIVLTGFSTNGSFVSLFQSGADFVLANLNQPFRFGNASFAVGDAILSSIASSLNISTTSIAATDLINAYGLTDYVAGLSTKQKVQYVDGYLANSNAASSQYLFFLPGFFDGQLAFAGEATKQPVTLGELLTLGSIPIVNNFAGPVLVITGCMFLFLSQSPRSKS